MDERTCIVDDCQKAPRSRRADLCPMHYHRQYRHGDVHKVATKADGVSLGRRYQEVYKPDHPLASKHGKVYVHRLVLFEEIGYGPHSCHWCSTEVDWLPKCDPRELQPDHLNNDGSDNRPENLVPSCRRCNGARGAQRRHDALVAQGFWSENDTIAALRTGGRASRVEPAT